MTPDPFLEACGGKRPFSRGWEAQIFATVVQLHRNGHFTWPEWTAKLGETNKNEVGDRTGFGPWVAALQKLLCERGVLTPDEIAAERRRAGHDH